MLRNIFLLLMLIAFTSSSYAKSNDKLNLYDTILQKDKIIVGISFDSMPFSFKAWDGQIKGLEADLAREITKRLLGSKDKVVFRDVATQDRIKLATSGDVDMVISTITITPQRKRVVDFSDPYFIAGQVICVRKDSKINSIDDLINKSVIVELGTTGEKNIKRLAPNALIQGYDNNSEAIAAFKEGLSDAITTDDALLQGLVTGNGDYLILPQKLTAEPYGIAFKKSRRTKSLKANVNNIIKEMKQDGTLGTIESRWEIN